jgi:hypothetical protein
MALLYYEICSNLQCSYPQKVFVNEDSVPHGPTSFAYVCPRCSRRMVGHPAAYVADATIPRGGIIAERCELADLQQPAQRH